MRVDEIIRKCWVTDEHDSRYILTWGRPNGWTFGFNIEPPHDSGGNYRHKKPTPDAEYVRYDYEHRSWSIELWFLWRGLYLARIKQTLIRVDGKPV